MPFNENANSSVFKYIHLCDWGNFYSQNILIYELYLLPKIGKITLLNHFKLICCTVFQFTTLFKF